MDDKDALILQLLNDDPGLSLEELRVAIQVNSIATAYNRVQDLTGSKLIEKTPPGTPRRRKLTPAGVLWLEQRFLIYHDPRQP
jgi:DNA-binding Lrp family transcriptional regulator